MVIECSSCHARFKLADDKIKESGTKVRCTKCREVFTVFPESPPPAAAPVALPLVDVAPPPPVVTQQSETEEDVFFSEPAAPSFTAETTSPAPSFDLPAEEEDDWNQDGADDPFSTEFADESGDIDLSSIRFDNTETPVCSVSNKNSEKFDFTDENSFSFTDSPGAIAPEETFKTSHTDDTQFFPGESGSDFEVDFTSTPSHGIAASEALNPFDTVTTESEFSLSGGESLNDLSWDSPESAPITTSFPDSTVGAEMPAEDKTFDFNSFSFDEVEATGKTEEKTSAEEGAVQSDATIDLATGNDSSSVPIGTKHSPEREAPLPIPLAGERKENTPRGANRPLRSRVRPKKKKFGRMILRIIMIVLVGFAATYGFMYRDQIEKTYTHLVNRFIEKQTRVETNGTIGLVKLSGSYVSNNLEGELFVIHGETVNEFKGLRSSILIKGTIFGDNGAALQSQSAYSGNPIEENNLKNSSFKEIREAMSNELGENLVNLNIAPGKAVPFTIVFHKAPKNIKEFSVEVLESKPGSK